VTPSVVQGLVSCAKCGYGAIAGRSCLFKSNDRRQAAQRADPTKRREDALRRNLFRIRKSIERPLTAYQEDLISLDELHQRMPDLRMREQTDQAELQAIVDRLNALRAYVSREPSRISSLVCAHRPEPSTSWSVSVFFGSW
jgi:hypothetical protein